MTIIPHFMRRDFLTILYPPDVAWEINRFSFTEIGGPDQASMTAFGDANSLWSLFNWLRVPVELRDERDSKLWWGYVHEVTVRVGAIEIGVTLDSLYNKIKVVYALVEPGSETSGSREDTDWASDNDSIGQYGTRALIHSAGDATDDGADSMRDAMLETQKLPTPTFRMNYGQGSMSATLRLRGWWHTLDWLYYGQSAGVESQITQGGMVTVGTTTQQKVAQSWSLGVDTSWLSYGLHVRAKTGEGEPTDTLRISLYDDNSGVPGTQLCYGDVSAIDEHLAWVSVVPSTTVTISYGTTYWVVVERTGSLDDANTFSLGVDEDAGYTRGSCTIYNGSAWVEYDADDETTGTQAVDLTFKVTGTWETTAVIEDIVDQVGQFLEGCDILDESGVQTNPYRDGDSNGATILEALLKMGTSNDKRLLAKVTPERYLQVYEEPERAFSKDTVLLDMDGTVRDRFGRILPATTPPVGVWCEVRDLPPTLGSGMMVDPSVQFITQATYDCKKMAWVELVTRGMDSPWELGQLLEG